MAFAARGVEGPFACTSQKDGQWGTITHTPEEIAQVQGSYAEWYQGLQVQFYQQQQAINNAHTVEAIQAIQF